MKIKQLNIENYRGFKNQNELIFKNNINVFVGVNGAGKTSLLDLIASFLNLFTLKFSGENNRNIEFNLSQFDINVDTQETINKICVETAIPFREQISWELKRDFKGTKNRFTEMNDYVFKYQELFKDNTEQNIPIFKYFQAQRNTNEKHKHTNGKKRYLSEQFVAYDDAFDKSMEFDEFIKWFIEEENFENREKIAKKDFNYASPNLKIIRESINKFFKNFKTDIYNNFRVEDRTSMSKLSEKSSLVIDKNKKTYNLKQLSDGEKLIILMIADIAHRLALANPNTKNAIKGFGIILIDEIELHLHPSWQRSIMACLLKTFPNLQFFVTTHSPQILSNINSEDIFILKDFEIIKSTPKTLGKDSNSILWDVFEVPERPKTSANQLEKFYDFLEKDKLVDAKKLLDKLTELLGENDCEITNAKLHYEFQNDTD